MSLTPAGTHEARLAGDGLCAHHPQLRSTPKAADREVLRMQSVLCMASCAVQRWRDASIDAMPRGLRPAWLLESLIALIECRHRSKLPNDASMCVVLARKMQRDRLPCA